jgi:Phage integrase family
VDRLAADGLAAATISTTITPLRAIYRRARQLGEAQNNPTTGLSVPSVNRRQQRFATVPQVEAMLDKLDSAKDRALWATAFYAGLRRGELMGLWREEVDLATGLIRVERGWDQCDSEVAPKSKQGRRKVPLPAALRDRLAEYLIDGPKSGRIFVGARDSYERGRKAAEAADVEPPTLHECRHGYAALMIAPGVNVKALSTLWATPTSGSPSTSTATCCRALRTKRPGCSTHFSPEGSAAPRSRRLRPRSRRERTEAYLALGWSLYVAAGCALGRTLRPGSGPGACRLLARPINNAHVVRTSSFLFFAGMITTLAVVIVVRVDEQSKAPDPETAALQWVGDGFAQTARREGNRWEVDVVRPDGSMVQVSLGDDLDLRGFDEEVGPGGTLAPDELQGRRRARAVQAAFAETRPGQVTSVERASSGEIEVCIRTQTGRQVEVELDQGLRVVEVGRKDPCDG